jgi:hypothetical protein
MKYLPDINKLPSFLPSSLPTVRINKCKTLKSDWMCETHHVNKFPVFLLLWWFQFEIVWQTTTAGIQTQEIK